MSLTGAAKAMRPNFQGSAHRRRGAKQQIPPNWASQSALVGDGDVLDNSLPGQLRSASPLCNLWT